jgi:hypothetical protein
MLDEVDLAHRIHILEAARHLLFTAAFAGVNNTVLKSAVMGLRHADLILDEEAEALIAGFGLEGA